MLTNDIFQEAKRSFVNGDIERSIELFSKAREEGCNPVNTLLSRGAAYLKLGEYGKSIEDFDQVLGIDADNERALYYRGVAHLLRKEYEEATSDLDRAIERNHERGAAFFARGLAHAELGHDDEAVRDLQTAVGFSAAEVGRFLSEFGSHRTRFERTLALLEGERGPLKIVLDETEAERLKEWTH